MDEIQTFLAKSSQRRRARFWLGPRPDVRTKGLPRAIAAMVGYPTSEDGWTEKHNLQQVDLGKAAEMLALAATESLAYGRRMPRESYRKSALSALRNFKCGAVFLTNTGGWTATSTRTAVMTYSALLTTATFEAGLIAYDSDSAMIFWVEEED